MHILQKISYGCTLVLAMTLCVAAEANSAKRASFQGLGDLPGGTFGSTALDVSADGSTVVGNSHIIGKYEPAPGYINTRDTVEAFRWTQKSGMQGLGDLPGGRFRSDATKVSADGSIVVGVGESDGFRGKPFRWTQQGGIEMLTGIVEQGQSYFVSGLSADGSIVVGTRIGATVGPDVFHWTEDGGEEIITELAAPPEYPPDISADGSTIAGYDQTEAVRLTQNGGIERLGDLPGGKFKSIPKAISADSSTVVGVSESANGNEAFRWTQKGGMQGLGDLPGGKFDSTANDVSADGSTVVGSSEGANGKKAFIWNRKNGMRSLQEILTKDFAIDLTGWSLEEATAISDDGLTIVGNGTNPDGNQEAWIVRLGEKNKQKIDDVNEEDDEDEKDDEDEDEKDDEDEDEKD